LEKLTSNTAIPFLRYLYTGSYSFAPEQNNEYDNVPTSILLHCRIYYLGHLYDMPQLVSQAYVNVLRQCEFGCSSPEKPVELCAAVRFMYESLREHENVIDAVVNYCVANFLRHRLAEDEEFKALPTEFQQAMAKNCMNRDIETESKLAISCLRSTN
jgi:hypothetical protein